MRNDKHRSPESASGGDSGGGGEPESLRFGRYRALKLLGEGAMGRVYLAEDPILKRRVAVKIIPTDNKVDPQVLREYLERFAVEAQACARLNHPSIVSIYDAGEENGVPWIAFEYVSGEHLDKLIANRKQLPFDMILRIAGDIAAAMRHAHNMNIVHRDIKPANILIDENSHIAKLADFGVVKAPFTAITQSGSAVGSPGYMSPEQIDDLEVDARSDIFSFGIVMYEMITGTHPFLRDTVQATFFATINCNFTPIKNLREDAPDELARIVEKALVADRNLRIVNADELCLMIAACIDDGDHKTRMMRAMGPSRGFWWQVKHIHALAARGMWSIWKKAAPFCRHAAYEASEFWKLRLKPPIVGAYNKIYGALEKRFTKSQITIAATAAVSVAAAVVFITLAATASARAGDRKKLVNAAQEKGYVVKNGKQLIDTCRAYIERCDYWHANQITDILIAGKRKEYALHGRLYRAMAALCADRFGEASELFEDVKKIDGGEAAIRKEHPFFIRYLEAWIERELPDALVDLCAEKLFLHNSYQVRAWTKNHHYWIRWNAVYILRKGGEKVDLVPVYILDLDHSASARTKIRAAEKLGELGDRRAVSALIAARDGKGPAASTARRVLREKFNVW